MRRNSFLAVLMVALMALLLARCETAPITPAAKMAMNDDIRASLARMHERDPGLKSLLDRSWGYVIFPSVGKGGLIVGGAYGRGEVYEQGKLVGYAELNQGSVGLQAGGQEFAELIVFQTEDALNRFRSGKFTFAADASAVVLKAGASGQARFYDGTAVFTHPQGGLMVEVSIGGQKFNYQPLEMPSEASIPYE